MPTDKPISSMNQAPARPNAGSWLPLLLLVLTASVWLYRTPFVASDLSITPDAVEYALAPLQLLETGRYEIILEGRGLPPRYPPWFPVSIILPAYVLFGLEPGNAILPITALAVAGVAFAWAIGRQLSSPFGGALAAIAVLFIPTYTKWASHVMSDVPATTLMLAGWLLFLRLRSKPAGLPLYFLAGAIVAIATLWRPVFAAMLLPFGLLAFAPLRMFLERGTALLIPMVAAVAATFAYNAATFGSISRNGYKLWAAVPVDYPRMLFSTSNVPLNLWVISQTALPIFAAVAGGAYLLLRIWRQSAMAAAPQNLLRDSVAFLALANGPILLFHLFYFFPSDRFHLPLMTGMAVLAGALLALLIGPQRQSIVTLLVSAILLLGIAGRIAVPEPTPRRRLAAERIREVTPENAIIIAAIEPVYLERLAAHGSARRIVPLSRNVEYASKLLAWKRVDHPDPPPRDWRDGRAVGLIRAGTPEAVQFVASEQLEALVRLTHEKTLYLETSWLHPDDRATLGALQERFLLVERAPGLYQLQAK